MKNSMKELSVAGEKETHLIKDCVATKDTKMNLMKVTRVIRKACAPPSGLTHERVLPGTLRRPYVALDPSGPERPTHVARRILVCATC